MKTLFVSDLHIEDKRPSAGRAFIELISNAKDVDALYILGDFVEYWIGDDAQHNLDNIFSNILSISKTGTKIYFMHGNRDFLIGGEFLGRYNIQLLPDPCVIDLYGKATLLMHGDLLCTDDSDYQNFRRMVRNPDWQSKFLSKSLDERRNIVNGLRKTSQDAMQDKPDHIMDVNQNTVEDMMRKYDVSRLIHGHTHRPAIHRFLIDNIACERVVLGDWYQDSSVLVCERGNIQLLAHDKVFTSSI